MACPHKPVYLMEPTERRILWRVVKLSFAFL